MTRFEAVFRQRHVVLPVIHVRSTDQTLRNAGIARRAECSGIFLINHAVSFQVLLEIHQAVFREFPDWWIGVNCLDLPPSEVFQHLTPEVSGLWVDNAEIDERQNTQPNAELVHAARERSRWKGLYFGGVAFKYQREVADVAKASHLASRYMDVVTTSGAGTGIAVSPDKVGVMKGALGNVPVAIASGITPENVHRYLAVADCFLVATGISQSFYDFDSGRVTKLVRAVACSGSAPPAT